MKYSPNTHTTNIQTEKNKQNTLMNKQTNEEKKTTEEHFTAKCFTKDSKSKNWTYNKPDN